MEAAIKTTAELKLELALQEADRDQQRAFVLRTAKAARMRRYRAKRREAPGPCEVCGAAVEGTRSDARYCSGACRQKAHRKRQKAEV